MRLQTSIKLYNVVLLLHDIHEMFVDSREREREKKNREVDDQKEVEPNIPEIKFKVLMLWEDFSRDGKQQRALNMFF